MVTCFRQLAARSVWTAAAVFALALGCPGGVASGGPPGKWTRVTAANGANIDEVGLARTGDGVLHVAWVKNVAPNNQEIWHTPVSAGGLVGAPTVAATGWNAAGNPDLVVLHDGGLREFFGGLGDTNEKDGVQSGSASAAGTAWTPQGSRVSASVSAAGPVGAAMLPDGTPIFAWPSGTNLFVHTGLNLGDPDTNIGPSPLCCFYSPGVATDVASGHAVLAFYSNVKDAPGIFVQTIRPSLGAKQLAPSSLTKGDFVMPDQRAPLVARAGGGLYLAYCGGYPTCGSVLLWKVGSGGPLKVATAPDVEDVNAAPGPEGRIWVMWHDHSGKLIYAKRSNRAVTRFGPTVSTSPPSGTSTIWKLDGEGSPGPLDVLTSVSTPGSLAAWHTQLLPPLTVSCAAGKVVSCTVTDAGDPVAAATLAIGGKRLKTSGQGKIAVDLPPGDLAVVASKTGYASATTHVRAK